MTATLTPRERELARHALGLNRAKAKCSYRNHFVLGPDDTDYRTWMGMVDKRFASVTAKKLFIGGQDWFHLTRAGAEAALEAGEELDSEDFPQ